MSNVQHRASHDRRSPTTKPSTGSVKRFAASARESTCGGSGRHLGAPRRSRASFGAVPQTSNQQALRSHTIAAPASDWTQAAIQP
jgi:hypothetical protein